MNLTDYNDLHICAGLDAVREQILAGISASPAPSDQPADADAPADTEFESRIGLDDALERFALAMPDGKVWDIRDRKLLKSNAARALLGPKLYREWLDHDNRRTVDQSVVQPLARAAAAQGGGGLADALERYVYLYPTSEVYDTQKRCEVPMSALKFAIADCYDDWLKHPHRRQLDREKVVFDPLQRSDPKTHINMFRGLAMTPVRDDDACRHIRHLIWHLCNENDEGFQWLIRWLAFPLQHIGTKMATAVLMHSQVQGSGKSLLFDGIMREIYGEYGATLGQHQLESQYTEWRSRKLFGLFEEIFSRDQKYQHTGTVKHMITGKTQRIEKKFVSGWEEANHMNAVFLSNEVQPFPIEASDRRMFVVWPKRKLPQDLKHAVTHEIKNGGVPAFFGWLLAVDTKEFGSHVEPPMTEEKERLIDFGRPGWEVFYRDWISGFTDFPVIPCQAVSLFQAYRRWCDARREHVVSATKFGGFIAAQEGVRRRKDVEYSLGVNTRKGTFIVPLKLDDHWRQRPDELQAAWLGRCAKAFEDSLGGDTA